MKTGKIVFNVPDDILASLRIGTKRLELDMRRFLAIQYFKNRRLSLGKAAKLAGLNMLEFIDFLSEEGIVVFDYDESAVTEELKGVKRLKELAR